MNIFDGLDIDIFESIFGFSINPVWLWIALMIIVLIAGIVKGADYRQRKPSMKLPQYIYRPTKPERQFYYATKSFKPNVKFKRSRIK
ncbi:hypothetical protein [Paenibacillus odorifer]|uniref:hypothetical protein n=1 Tax=Paenibacillus odorifer TaxID=189426 RepID=UPI00096BDAA1|nr:hypothetical protein [Paenibacillus odorifer]OMD66668.1 hypothetical protein BSK50_30675 [Paenibacillus odorifer]